jgi:hypothetical protein
MNASKRTPLPFTLDEKPTPPIMPTPKLASVNEKEERQQVGARVKTTTYRQLKARAAMEGVKVQDLVEQAIVAFLNA